MAVLSDRALRILYPSLPFVGPASIDLHVGNQILRWPRKVVRDPRLDQSATWEAHAPQPLYENAQDDLGWRLFPGFRYLATTRERVTVLPSLAGQVSARSSWGRDGLAVVCGPAGWIDPGFSGEITLELSVIGSTLVLRPGDRVAQIVLFELTAETEWPYDGKYQGQRGPTPSRVHLDGAS